MATRVAVSASGGLPKTCSTVTFRNCAHVVEMQHVRNPCSDMTSAFKAACPTPAPRTHMAAHQLPPPRDGSDTRTRQRRAAARLRTVSRTARRVTARTHDRARRNFKKPTAGETATRPPAISEAVHGRLCELPAQIPYAFRGLWSACSSLACPTPRRVARVQPQGPSAARTLRRARDTATIRAAPIFKSHPRAIPARTRPAKAGPTVTTQRRRGRTCVYQTGWCSAMQQPLGRARGRAQICTARVARCRPSR